LSDVSARSYIVAPGRGEAAEARYLDVVVVVTNPGGTAFCINERLRCHRVANATGRGSEPACLSKLIKLIRHCIEKPTLQMWGPIEHPLNA
jgi:hypothetical protein